MLYKKIALLFLMVAFLVTGCKSPVYDQTEANIADVKIRVDEARALSNAAGKPKSSLVVNDGAYIDRTPINLARQPSWMKKQVIIRGDQLPFTYYSRTIVNSRNSNVLTHFQVGLDETTKVSLDYSGTVKGALDLLAAKTGYIYTVNGNSIYWQAFVSKTFEIAFMPGSSDYMMGKAAGGGSISNVANGGASGSATVSAIIDDSAANQYSTLKGTLSIWKDLENTIKQLLSANGTVSVSESTTSVTVRDKPTNVALVGKYIANLNHNLSKQVLVKVQVLDVTLANDYSYGINWDAMKKALGSEFFLNMDFGTPVSITPLNGAATTAEQFGMRGSGVTSVTALITALNQQSKVSVVTEPRVVCLNNQVSVIRIVSQQGYLASVQTTALAGTGTTGTSGSVTSQLTPGSVTTGLTLYILPKILGKKVFLQVNADLSTNDGIATISSDQGNVANGSNTSGSNIIQVPNVTQKQFNQRSVIASGDTLILSGFRSVTNQTGAMQLLTSQALGGKASTEQTKETIVLITPIVLPGYA